MKILTTLLTSVLFVWLQPLGAIDFFHGTWEEALLKAKEEKKIIFVDAYTSWCGPCKLMSSRVFPQENVSKFYNDKFINVKLDMEKGEGPTFAKKYGIRAYPTLLYIDDKGILLQRKVGVMQANELISTGKAILKKFNRKEDYDKLYAEKKNHSAAFILDYLKELRKAGASTAKVANVFLRSSQNLTADTLAMVGYEGVETVDSRLFEILNENKAQLIEKYGEANFKKRIEEACEETLQLAIEYDSPELVNDIAKVESVYGHDILPLYRIKYSLLEKDWQEAVSSTVKMNKSDIALLWDVLEELDVHVKDHAELTPAVGHIANPLVKHASSEEELLNVFGVAMKTNDEQLIETLKKSAKKKLAKLDIDANDFYSKIK